ncbi:MAG TPA: bifunctional diguanylate cyclase/phosphodiesterase [Solirubrobacteraceae bacterium]|nr:bifunctional diguanylate cyclase/phosphodiesterase [Solirubrobacteraceae bacterium]
MRDANKRSFESTATDLSSALAAKLGTNLALTRTMRVRAAMETQESETQFLQWFAELQRGTSASPDVVATFIQVVPASKLAAFQRQVGNDPAFRRLLGARLQVFPGGRRPVYCLTRAIVGSAVAASVYPGLLDYCAPVVPGTGHSPYPALVRTATDTGTFIVAPLPTSGTRSLVAIGAAVYRRGASIATVSARRAALTGVIGTTFDSATTIHSVLSDHRSVTLALYHRNAGGPQQLIGRAGANPAGRSPGYFSARELGEGWLLETSETAEAFASPDAKALVALGLGLLVTMLVFLLHLVFSRSRQRAWGLVGQRTGELEHRALHDSLTELPNRILVVDRAEQIIRRARRLDAPVTALFVDIDDFKQINDRHGHDAGDAVLRQVAARLKTAMRENDTVGRLGGDEFAMLIDSVGLYTAPELVAERVLDVLRQPIGLSGEHAPVSITASIGIATGRPASAEDLMQDADLALHKAKAIGKNGYVKFESAMQIAAQDRIHLEMDLAKALELDQLFLVYQPMLDLASERVVGVEALLRWRHPVGGVIAPDVFVPIAEDNGLIVQIGRWVLDSACRQGAAWHRNGYPLNISINASACQLERPEFVEEVRAALQRHALEPTSLTIEITETVLMRKPDETAWLLGQLKALGVRIAVDDFGTGYSSLAYLRQFPVDSLKIDRTFITGLSLSREAHALTHTLIQLGKSLGLQTVAEGVEQHSQVRELQREGCNMAQGFLFARPLAPDVVESFLSDSNGLADTFADQPSLLAVGP